MEMETELFQDFFIFQGSNFIQNWEEIRSLKNEKVVRSVVLSKHKKILQK